MQSNLDKSVEKQQKWVNEHPILTLAFRSILVCGAVGLFFWYRSEPELDSKPDLNVKSEIIAKQKFTPYQTYHLKIAENLLEWDEATQANFTALFGSETSNYFNIQMSIRKPELVSLKPCLMKPKYNQYTSPQEVFDKLSEHGFPEQFRQKDYEISGGKKDLELFKIYSLIAVTTCFTDYWTK